MTPAEQENGTEAFQSLHPNHLKVLRARAVIGAVVLLLAAGVPAASIGGARGVAIFAVAALLAAVIVLILPRRRYRATAYRETDEELFIDAGVLVRVRTVVPFGRVQHSDVGQGPLQRRYGVATLTLHTAGTAGGSVDLPGLAADEAEAMRDRIRAMIRQEIA